MKLLDFEIPTAEEYDRLAYEYMASLPPEHYMELSYYGFQRGITLSSFRMIGKYRPEVQIFNEVLIQYPRDDGSNGQVVPDQMVVLNDQPIAMNVSFNNVYQPTTPFMILEYVSKGASNQRKDYVINRRRYEQELKVPYYLLFDPGTRKLTFFELVNSKYRIPRLNSRERYAVEEIDVEIALLGDWVRFWYAGELQPLPEEYAGKSKEKDEKIASGELRVEEEKRRAEEAMSRASDEKIRAEEEKRRADDEKRRADEEKRRADEAIRHAGHEKIRADQEAVRVARLVEKLKALGIDPDA